MKPTPLVLLIILLLSSWPSRATWSIIITDDHTKMIGIAGASCTPNVHGIGLIMPGKGAIVVQAMSNGFARYTGFQMIMKNVPAVSIIQKLREPAFDPENQQYAVLCLYDNNMPQTYTGTKNHGYAGVLTAPGISVQGNTLTGPEVIKAAFEAAVKAKKDSLPLEEILMKALEAGANAGGDKRCGERRASSAFLTVSKPDYLDKHWLEIIVTQKDDHTAAVQQLKKEFDNWKLLQKDKALRVPPQSISSLFISSRNKFAGHEAGIYITEDYINAALR